MEFEWNLVSIPKYIKFLWLFTPTQLISLTPKKSTATIFYLRQKIKIISWKLDLVTTGKGSKGELISDPNFFLTIAQKNTKNPF